MVTPFGKICRKIRIDRDETMRDMADKFGFTHSHLSAIEHGKRTIPKDLPMKLIQHYKLSQEDTHFLLRECIIESLSEREREALNHATSAIYFNDSSDYISGLWGVVSSLIGDDLTNQDSFSIEDLYDTLSREDYV